MQTTIKMNEQRGEEIVRHVSAAVESLIAAKPMVDMLVNLCAYLCDAEEELVASPDTLTSGRQPEKSEFEKFHTAKEARTIIARHVKKVVDETVRFRLAIANHYGRPCFWKFPCERWTGGNYLLQMSQQRFTELQPNAALHPSDPAELVRFQEGHPHHRLFERFGRILIDINNELLSQLEEPMQHETKIFLENGSEERGPYISIGSMKHSISECKESVTEGLKGFCEDLHLPPPQTTEEARSYSVSLRQHHRAVMEWAIHLASTRTGDFSRHL